MRTPSSDGIRWRLRGARLGEAGINDLPAILGMAFARAEILTLLLRAFAADGIAVGPATPLAGAALGSGDEKAAGETGGAAC